MEDADKGKFCINPSPSPLVHITQRYRWDCGVACVMMVLPPEKRHELMTRFHEVCREEGFGNSTWTIDLCYLLKRYGVKHHMYTTVLGVNEAHRNNKYYQKIFDLDVARVRRRLSSAAELGVRVSAGGWGLPLLRRHAASRQPAIVLLDGARLACDLCKRNKITSQFRSWFGGEYRGHYVVVVSCSGSHVRYLDPAPGPRPHCACAATVSRFMAASARPGTDSDVILVYNRTVDTSSN